METDTVRALDALHATECTVRLGLLDKVAEADRAEMWRKDGAASMAGWLVARYRVGQSTAAEWVRVAKALEGLPEIRRAYREARLSWDQLRHLTRFAQPEGDEAWAEDAPEMSVAALRREARRPKAADVREAHELRSVEWWYDDDRPFLHLRARFCDTDGALLVKGLRHVAEQLPRNPATGRFDEYGARCADALVQLVSQRLGSEGDADRATLVVHARRGDLAKGDGRGEVEDGPSLTLDALLRLACDGRVQPVLHDESGNTVGVGRTTRKIPPWLARLVRERDKGCRFPGCGRTRWVEIHHIVTWWWGEGPTNLDNLITLCRYHHRLVHEDGWSIRGNPSSEVHWLDSFGRECVPRPPAPELELARRIRRMAPDVRPPNRVRASALVDTS
jgi:hypothetical protein